MALSEKAAALERLHEQIRQCHDCGLCATVTHYVVGEGPADAEVMLVGEAPGAEEDAQGRPFVGRSGQLLTRLLADIGLPRDDMFITSVVKCRPPGNRDPLPRELAACRQHLVDQIPIIQPKVVGTLGRFAAHALIDRQLSISRGHGRPRRIDGILYLPLYHPAAALHQQRLMGALEADMRRLRGILETELRRRPGRADG